jgi:hypothetical protein
MPQFQDVLTYKVDFNHFDKDGEFLKGSLWHGSSRRIPKPGERVLLCDGEGNRCWASVRDVHGVIVRFELDDSTWVSGEQSETTTIGGDVVGRWSS